MSRERNRRILFISGVGLGQRGAQLLSTLITLPLVLHALGVAGFGLWGAATSMGWLSGMLDLGLGSALLTLLPERLAAGQGGTLHRYITASLLAGCGMMVLALAGGGAIIWAGGLHLALPLLVACIALAVNIPLNISRDIWFGLQKGQIAGYWDFIQTLLTLLLLVAAAWRGAGVTAMTAAVYAAMLTANAASLAHVLIRHPELRAKWGALGDALTAILGRGSMMFAITIAGSCGYSFDTLLALHWLGPDASAQMVVAQRVCTTAIGFLNIISLPLWPAFVEAVTLDDRAWLRRSLRNGTLFLTVLAMAGSLCIVAVGAPVLRLWLHRDMHIGPVLLWAMAGWIIILTLPRVSGLLLNAAMALRAQLAIMVAVAILGFVLKYFAARMFGVAGILATTPALWLIMAVPAYFWLARRRIDARKPMAATE